MLQYQSIGLKVVEHGKYGIGNLKKIIYVNKNNDKGRYFCVIYDIMSYLNFRGN